MHVPISIITIGTSRLGRPINAYVLGHGNTAVLINAAHHANEWITALLAMQFLHECITTKDTSWVEKTTLHIVPLVNPDGVALVTGSNNPHWKANIVGVDLNSNYPANWDKARADKFARGYTHPGPRDYVGPAPLSEPESSALAAYTITNDFDCTISLHTQGEEIFWQYENYNPPGAQALALRLSAASGYKLEDVPDTSSHAGYRDWFIQTLNRPGYTIECGLGESPLPLSDFEDIYKKVAPLLWEAITYNYVI